MPGWSNQAAVTRLQRTMLRIALRKLQAVLPNRQTRWITGMGLTAVIAFAVKFGLYDPVKSYLDIAATQPAIGQLSTILAIVFMFSLAALLVGLIASFSAIAPPAEAVVALPIPADTWHTSSVRTYSWIVLFCNAGTLSIIVAAALRSLDLSFGQWIALIGLVLFVLIGVFRSIQLAVLALQDLPSQQRLGAILGISLGLIFLAFLAHSKSWDAHGLQILSRQIAQEPYLFTLTMLFVLPNLTKLYVWGRNILVDYYCKRFLALEINQAQRGRHVPLLGPLPSLVRVSLLAMARDRRASAWVGVSLAIVGLVTLAIRNYHNPALSDYIVFISPFLVASIMSSWLNRLRAYLGPNRLVVYALPLRPNTLIIQQGLIMSMLMAALSVGLIAAQMAALNHQIHTVDLLGQWGSFTAIFGAYYLISAIFSQNRRNFTVNNLVDAGSVIFTFIITLVFAFLRNRASGTAKASVAMAGILVIMLAAAYYYEHRMLQGAA
jgi:hypothetical protein